MKFLVLHESVHILLTTLIAFFLYRRFKNWKLVLVAFLVVIFLDLDHLFDYFYYALSTSNFSFPFATDYFHGSGKVFVLLHGWELSLPFWFISKKIGRQKNISGLEWAVVFSYLGHLLVDQFFYTSNILAYFLIFRILIGFDLFAFNGL